MLVADELSLAGSYGRRLSISHCRHQPEQYGVLEHTLLRAAAIASLGRFLTHGKWVSVGTCSSLPACMIVQQPCRQDHHKVYPSPHELFPVIAALLYEALVPVRVRSRSEHAL